MPSVAVLDGATQELGAQAVIDEIRRNGEGTDRRLGYLLTAAGFITAFSGHTIGLNADEGAGQSILLSSATLAAFFAFLAALRGTTRRVDPPLVLDKADADLVRSGAHALASKNAYAWLSSRCLLIAVIFVALVNWLDSVINL